MNKVKIASAALAGALALTAPAAVAQSVPSPHDEDPTKITISCYRGWLADTVAWDRPNSVFVEDLVQLGYSRDQAMVIGEHICRDEYGVNNPSHQRAQLVRILREDPPS
jgi:hypothetical protein